MKRVHRVLAFGGLGLREGKDGAADFGGERTGETETGYLWLSGLDVDVAD